MANAPLVQIKALKEGLIQLDPPLPWRLDRSSDDGSSGRLLGMGRDVAALEIPPKMLAAPAIQSSTSSAARSSNRIGMQLPIVVTKSNGDSEALTIELQRPLPDNLWLAQISVADQLVWRDLLSCVRKEQHIALCQHQVVESTGRLTGFESVVLQPISLPSFDLESTSFRRTFLGSAFEWPILITGMTGGLAEGALINRRLATAAAKFGIPMGVGSQRIALEEPKHQAIFAVKNEVPDVFLIGNIGFAQLVNKTKDEALDLCQQAIKMINADAMAIHLNLLQELVQVEGDRSFSGNISSRVELIANLSKHLSVPLIVKEVGCGLDLVTAAALAKAGVGGLDIGGRGGTSWSRIEGLRAPGSMTARLGETFQDWGIPTAFSLAKIRSSLGVKFDLIATGGLRTGLDAAKAVGLGATMAGFGLPLFKAALQSEDEVLWELEAITQELRIAMACSAAQNLGDLPERIRVDKKFHEQMELYMT